MHAASAFCVHFPLSVGVVDRHESAAAQRQNNLRAMLVRSALCIVAYTTTNNCNGAFPKTRKIGLPSMSMSEGDIMNELRKRDAMNNALSGQVTELTRQLGEIARELQEAQQRIEALESRDKLPRGRQEGNPRSRAEIMSGLRTESRFSFFDEVKAQSDMILDSLAQRMINSPARWQGRLALSLQATINQERRLTEMANDLQAQASGQQAAEMQPLVMAPPPMATPQVVPAPPPPVPPPAMPPSTKRPLPSRSEITESQAAWLDQALGRVQARRSAAKE